MDFILSIKPKHVANILSGKKTVEFRRKFPTENVIGRRIFIYSSSPVQAIVAVAHIENVSVDRACDLWAKFGTSACVSKEQFDQYYEGVEKGYGISLERVDILENSIPIIDLKEFCSFSPPQSYRYVKGKLENFLDDFRLQISSRH